MTERDREAFADVLCGLGDTFNEPVSAVRMEVYFQALSDLTLEQINQAALLHAKSSRFFPKPVELREAIAGSVTDRADEAWAQLLMLVRRVGYTGKPEWLDPVLERTAKELYGGWQALCARLPSEGPELLGQAKLFKATYAAYARRASVDRLALPSRDDAKTLLANLKRDLDARSLPAPGLVE
jgi:hypothetical protein